ncbi:hypothetical protein JCM30237_17610 [Halolamina litorea]|jgi:hypothetical protein|uniref:Uncharacterized protein n=1 Tax=Halolamina litorea TaxID=1515593 RepID=A0ABD6BSH1_9EURY|nr:hypothetical protein [Halolamina litorea]
MDIVGKPLQTRLLRAFAVLVVLLVYGAATDGVDPFVTLSVPVLFFAFSIASDYAVARFTDN